MVKTILSFKPGHDGHVVYLKDGELIFSLEAEQDSFPRHADVTPSIVLDALARIDDVPDVVAVSGWVKGFHSIEPPLEAGYFGYSASAARASTTRFLGRNIKRFTSTHERSHIFGAYGMSPFKQGEPCYMLLWEGTLGAFYEIDAEVNVTRLGHVMDEPGNKYSFLFSLADPTYKDTFRFSNAGKLMALAAYSDRGEMSEEEARTADYILDHVILKKTRKSEMEWSPYYNLGVEHEDLKNLAGKFSNRLFDRFHRFAKENIKDRRPLLIGGGCGLNCEWNTKWRNSGLFTEVFVPPVANDTGAGIGTAIEAQFHYTGNAKISWNAYAGAEFNEDQDEVDGFEARPLDFDEVARFLAAGDTVIAWTQGRTEIGPRALGNRSILASPFQREMQNRLNWTKRREGFRPVAPICLEEDVHLHFDWQGPSPYMLYFQQIKDPRLKAVSHVDQSARIQTVNSSQNPQMHRLLMTFKKHTGCGVLCNTSLNFLGRGFINSLSDLAKYAKERELDGFVAGKRFFVNPKRAALVI